MKIYHGTTKTIALASLNDGLVPRGERPSRWQDNPSRSDAVYLTDAYAPYFAAHSADTPNGEQWGIVEVDTDLLDDDAFVPDEDWLEQASRHGGVGGAPDGFDRLSMNDRTCWFRDNSHRFSHTWKLSLEGLGNCAHLGEVPSEAITRVSIFNPEHNPTMAFAALDPQISLLNYRLLGNKYRALTRWFAGHDVTVDEWMAATFAMIFDDDPTQQQARRDARTALWESKSRAVVIIGQGAPS